MKRAALLLLVGTLAVCGAAGAGATQEGTATQDLGWLNAQRAANGIPAAVGENAGWSAKCDAHVTYMQKTGQFGGAEDPSSPFHTAGGSWAGRYSVLALGKHWGAGSDPWESSPIHLILLMDPQLAKIGIADRGGYICATSWPGFTRTPPATTTVVTYPGDGTTIYTHELDKERPFTPQSILGLSGATGPNLLVYVWGPALRNVTAAGAISITAATLSSKHGSVPVKWVDHRTATIGPYLPAGSGVIVPVKPLASGTTYTASVTFSDHQSRTWSFTTK